jgi:GNAT superfamily N-acetyltransferase
MNPDRATAQLWAAFLRNRNVDAGTAGDGAIPVAGGYALYVAGTRFDFVIGAGSTRALRDDDLAVVEEFYAARAHPARFQLDEAVLARDGALLRDRGYAEEDESIAMLEAAVAAVPPSGVVTVRTTANRRAWADLAVRAFADTSDDPTVLRRTLQTAAAAARVLVIASLDGEDAGTGALGISGDLALLWSGAVLPAFRRRGVHQALLAARLALAHEHGAKAAAIQTVAHSPVERSAAKLGFARTGLRRRVHRAAR